MCGSDGGGGGSCGQGVQLLNSTLCSHRTDISIRKEFTEFEFEKDNDSIAAWSRIFLLFCYIFSVQVRLI